MLTGHQGVQPVHGFLPEVRGLRALVQGLHAGVVPLHLGLMSLGGAVRRFCFAAGAGLGHSCRRSRWEALRRRAPADSYCPGNTQERPGGNSERSAVTVLYRKAEGFTSTARISRYRRITKSDKDSAVIPRRPVGWSTVKFSPQGTEVSATSPSLSPSNFFTIG